MVMSFCSVIVWQAPSRAYGVISGYDLMLFNPGNASESSVINKERDELFHIVKESDLAGSRALANIQVCNC
jgi:hypothetical protein